MSVVSVKARSFILALFIRDDGERFLLGDNGYDFKDSQLHFAANTIENDEVMKQGADGVIVAGQVRRASVQSFDGYVGDATMAKETIEQMRRDFFAFFVKGHHFRVIYIDCNRNAWQRKGGYLVDAPEVKELWQIHPEYHVGLNFEDVNYYSYDEDADGNEILANLLDIPVSTAVAGGLVWDEDGAVSEDAVVDHDAESAGAQGKSVYINDAAEAPLSTFKLDGETSQNGTPTPDAPVAVNTTTGENVVKITGKNLLKLTNGTYSSKGVTAVVNNGIVSLSGTATANAYIVLTAQADYYSLTFNGSYKMTTQTTSGIYNVVYYGTSSQMFNSTGPQVKTLNGTYNDIRFQLYIPSGTNTNGITTSPMIIADGTDESFEPYQGQSYPISLGSLELCKIGTYQDYIYKSDGKWYVHKAVGKLTLTGDDSEGWSSTGTNVFATINGAITGSKFPPLALCRYATFNPVQSGVTGTLANGEFAVQYNDGHNSRVFFKNTAISDVSGFVAWVSENTPAIYYAFATATDTEITNQALIAQLNALLTTARTYAGINNIFTITTNEQGTLEIGYYTKYQQIVTGGGYVWEAGGAGGATIVVNNSIDNVNPIWKIYGPTMNPQLENSTTGEVIEYVGLIAEGQTLTIDMGEQTASLDGLNVISNLVGDFVSLAPGANRLIYSVSGDAGASEIGWSEIVG